MARVFEEVPETPERVEENFLPECCRRAAGFACTTAGDPFGFRCPGCGAAQEVLVVGAFWCEGCGRWRSHGEGSFYPGRCRECAGEENET